MSDPYRTADPPPVEPDPAVAIWRHAWVTSMRTYAMNVVIWLAIGVFNLAMGQRASAIGNLVTALSFGGVFLMYLRLARAL